MKQKVLVCQNGARHRYAIPRLFEGAGMLAGLYTDSTAYSPVGKAAIVASRLGLKHPKIKALASRVPNGVPRSKVFSTDRSSLSASDSSTDFRKWGLQDADVVYSMYGENLDFLKWAQSQGAKVITDVFVHPATNRIVAEEQLRCLNQQIDNQIIEAEDRHSKDVFGMSDILLCPSEWVADGVRDFMPGLEDKVVVSPYGNSLTLKGAVNTPTMGRILFAGREPLRKGLHYLAEAAHILRNNGLAIEVRVAGVEENEIDWMEHRQELNCLGHIPLDKMQEEYSRADAFILPSLSEGQAGVVLEALACGCPVIASRESGIDFEQDAGVTVPVRNAEAIAEAVEKIVTDRVFRNRISAGARKQSSMFSMEAYQSRLIDLINTLA